MLVRLLAQTDLVAVSSLSRMVWVAPLGSMQPPARMTAPVRAVLGPNGWELTDASRLVARFNRSAIVAFAAEEGLVGAAPEVAGVVAGSPVVGRTGDSTWSRNAGAASASPVIVNGKSYPGIVTLTARTDGSLSTFDVIDRLPLEDYLRGVVAAEMYSGWPLSAYQAQAVAARSYALSERARARAARLPFDVESGERDQAFGNADNPLASRAVAETRGVILSWRGHPMRAYFSSTCGGRPASARDTWPSTGDMLFNLDGPIQGSTRDHACTESPSYRWSVTRGTRELVERFRAFGRYHGSPLKNLSGIDSIRPAGVNGSGRTNSFLIVQPGGQSILITGEELRRAANFETPGQPAITAQSRVPSSDAEVVIAGDRVGLSGRGFGHGVGMCQWCAKGFAEKGQTWQSMLARFYPGAKLERVY